MAWLTPAQYQATVGDVVVGRVVAVRDRRWLVDVGAAGPASLDVASVNLEGAEQRRRTAADEAEMRSRFAEGDIVSAEVQMARGGIGGMRALHTRGTRYRVFRDVQGPSGC